MGMHEKEENKNEDEQIMKKMKDLRLLKNMKRLMEI